MSITDQPHGESSVFAGEPRTAEGAAAITSLQALSDCIHDADEQALHTLRMLPIDAVALRYLVQAHHDGRTVNPTQLARALRISTAGITKLVDRLERDGRVERQPNPKDRRGVIVLPAGTAEQDLLRAYGSIQAQLIATIDALSADDALAVQRFASRLAEAIRGEIRAPGVVSAH